MEQMNPRSGFSGEKAEVTDYLIDLAANLNFEIDADGSGLAGLRDEALTQSFPVPGMPMR